MNNFYYLCSTKYRFFQYRVLSKKLITNVTRNKWDKDISPRCVYCKQKYETIVHLFCECEVTQWFIANVIKCIEYITNQRNQLTFTKSEFILNNSVGQYTQFKIILFTALKHYIYATKCLNNQLSPIIFMGILHNMYVDEKHMAMQRKNMYKFGKKWSMYNEYCINAVS